MKHETSQWVAGMYIASSSRMRATVQPPNAFPLFSLFSYSPPLNNSSRLRLSFNTAYNCTVHRSSHLHTENSHARYPHHKMHSPLTTLLTTLLAPLAAQAVAFTNSNYDGITAGIPFTLTWSGNGTVRTPYPPLPHPQAHPNNPSQPADLVLATGPSNDLSKVMTIIGTMNPPNPTTTTQRTSSSYQLHHHSYMEQRC